MKKAFHTSDDEMDTGLETANLLEDTYDEDLLFD